MNWWGIGFLLLVLCFVVIWYMKISIKIMACYTQNGSALLVEVRVLFFRYTYNVLEAIQKQKQKEKQEPKKASREKEGSGEWLEKLPELIKSVGEIHTIGKRFTHTIRVKTFLWRSHLGTGDAALTGIVAGYLWGIKGIMVGVISHYTKLVNKPTLEIVPIYQGEIITTEFECILQFRVGKAVRTGWAVLRYIRKKTIFIKGEQEVTS